MNKVVRGGVSFNSPKSTAPAVGRRHIRVAGFSPDFQKFLTMLALIAYAFFWAYLGALFMEHFVKPQEAAKPVLAFEQIVRPDPPPCDDAPDLYDCQNYREAE